MIPKWPSIRKVLAKTIIINFYMALIALSFVMYAYVLSYVSPPGAFGKPVVENRSLQAVPFKRYSFTVTDLKIMSIPGQLCSGTLSLSEFPNSDK